MFLHFHHGFLVVFALAILILLWSFWPSPVVIILFVSSFTCTDAEGQLGWFFYLPFLIFLFWSSFFWSCFFLWSCFFYLSFFVFSVLAFTSFLGSFPFSFFPSFFAVLFFCLVLLFVSSQSILAILWCTICVTVIINLSVILSTLHLCYSYPCFLSSKGCPQPPLTFRKVAKFLQKLRVTDLVFYSRRGGL